MKTNVGPLGLFCTALLVSALTLSLRSTAGYSQYDTASQIPSNTIPIVTKYADEATRPPPRPPSMPTKPRASSCASRKAIR